MDKNHSARNPSINRLNYSLTALMLVYFVSRSELILSGHVSIIQQVFRTIMVAVFAVLWFVSTMVRLNNIGWRRAWILVFLSLYAIEVYAKLRGQSLVAGVELIVVLLVQLPLMLLPARERHAPAGGPGLTNH